MATIAEALALAVRHHQEGDIDYAEQIYRRVLEADPDNPAAHYHLGQALASRSAPNEAIACFEEALRHDPGHVEARTGLRQALIDRHKQALRFLPDHPQTHFQLALAYNEQDKREEAIAAYREALRLKPDYGEAAHNLAGLVMGQGDVDGAVAILRQSLRFCPHLAESHNQLGLALAKKGELLEAEASIRQALACQPEFSPAHNNLGVVLRSQGRLEVAAASFRQALRIAPDFADASYNLGLVLGDQPEEAVAAYQQAVRLRPDSRQYHYSLHLPLKDLHRLDEALATLDQAISLDPNFADAHWDRAVVWLLGGDFERGWPEYEWRWRCSDCPRRPLPQPLWDGSVLTGRTILLYAEQGLGDTLHFIRYAMVVKKRGARVVFECPKALPRLLSGCPGIDTMLAAGAPLPEFDVHAPLMSLPALVGTTLATVPADVPYISADTQLSQHWRAEIRQGQGLKIGVAWQGNRQHSGDSRRSFALDRFAPLARLEGIRLFSLQKGPGAEQIGAGKWFPISDRGNRLDETAGPFMDTAAVMKQVDLVVTVDTAIAHLAGALGVPVWVALSYTPDWRWLLDREDCPWYPSMRLFRQTTLGDWDSVFERIEKELRRLWL